MSKELKAMLLSYGRVMLATVSALLLAGVYNPADLAWSLFAALIPVILRALNPNDPAYGRVPTVAEVEEALSEVTPKKAPSVKKPAAKK